MNTCENCRFWTDREDYPDHPNVTWTVGKCRRHAPVVQLKPNGWDEAVWPKTSMRDWCGEHAPKEDPDDPPFVVPTHAPSVP